MVVMDVFTRRIIGFGVAAANLNGIRVCRMFNRAIARQRRPAPCTAPAPRGASEQLTGSSVSPATRLRRLSDQVDG